MRCAPLIVVSFVLWGCSPAEQGGGERVAVARARLTVAEAVAAGCSTSQVAGLSQQIIAQSNCIAPGAFVELAPRPNTTFGSAVLPFMEEPARDALGAALDANASMDMQINSMLRTVAQQYLLYRWYQQNTCGIGLAATPGTSNHETGLAIDVQQYSAWRPILEAHDFAWLGASDPVHFDYQGAGAVDYRGTDVLAFQELWNVNHPEAPIDEDGDYGPQTEGALEQAPAEGFALGPTCGEPSDGLVVSAVLDAADSLDDGPSLGIADVHEGKSYTLDVTVTNNGTAALDAGTLTLEGDAHLSPKEVNIAVPALTPGASHHLTTDVEATAYSVDVEAPASVVLSATAGDQTAAANVAADVYSERRWTFDGGRMEGWTGGALENGALVADVADGPAIAADGVRAIALRVRSDGAASIALAHDGEPLDGAAFLPIDIPADGAFHDLVLADLPDSGLTVTQLRFSGGALDELTLEMSFEPPSADDEETADAGCGCSTPGALASSRAWLAGAIVALSLLRRRRRRPSGA